MIYGSVCSGVEAASVAWEPLGWNPAWFCEFDKFPSAVLAHHFPDVPNLHDMTQIEKRKEYNDRSINLLVGGTPCQSFSVAGLRKGLDDDRGNLALKFCQILRDKQPRWFVWENVPGVLSSNQGRDFAAILSGFSECGYGFAYRILDAQHFGVPQRRRRVFVVGHLGDWRHAAAVLFEQASLQGHIAPRKTTREDITGYTASSFGGYRAGCGTLRAEGGDLGGGSETLCVHGTQDPCTQKETSFALGRNNGQENVVAYGIQGNTIGRKPQNGGNGDGFSKEISGTLTTIDRHAVAFGFSTKQMGLDISFEQANTLLANDYKEPQTTFNNQIIRRLTPIECERLQGFPDDWTNIPYRGKNGSPDGARYKAMGNSMAVPVMRWIGERIDIIDKIKPVE